MSGAAVQERTQRPDTLDASRAGLRSGWLRSEPALLAAMLVSIGIFYYAPGIIGAALGVLLFFALTVYRPDLSLAMVPLTAPLFYRPRTLTGDKYVALAEMIILVGAAAWALRDGVTLVRTRRLPDVRAIVRQPYLPFALLLGIIATLWLLVPAPGDPRRVALREFRWTIVEPLLFFGMTLRWLKSERDIWRMVGAWLIGAALIGREGAEQYFFGQTWSMEGVGRVSSVYPSATAFGIYSGRALALSLTLALFLPMRARMWKLGAALLSIPIGLGVLFSFARGAWIGVFVALVVAAFIARDRRVLIGLGALVLAVVAALPFIKVERITSIFNFDTQDNTGVSRLRIWAAALRVIKDHPITGIGQDQFLTVDPKYGVPHVRFLTVSHPHDWILDFWLRLGLPGLAWLVAALGYFFVKSHGLWRKHIGTTTGALVLGLIASMTDFAVHGLMDMAYFTMDLALTFWLTVGLVALVTRLTRQAKEAPTAESSEVLAQP